MKMMMIIILGLVAVLVVIGLIVGWGGSINDQVKGLFKFFEELPHTFFGSK